MQKNLNTFGSQGSLNSLDKAPVLFAKDRCASIYKARKLIDLETKRVDFHKQARENAIKVATD